MSDTEEKRGRPTIYTDEIAAHICMELALGRSLRAICREDENMPDERTVRSWAMERKDFSPQYAKARELGYQAMEDDILEFADDKQADTQRSRLQVDTRKWLMSKALPKRYGDKVAHQHTGRNGGPIETIDLSMLSAEELEQYGKLCAIVEGMDQPGTEPDTTDDSGDGVTGE